MTAPATHQKLDPEPIRDPRSDHLLTPQNCVIVFIDFQEGQYGAVESATRAEIDLGAVTLAQVARAYDVPTVISTVGVGLGGQGTVDTITGVLPDVAEIDRTGLNSWEDANFRAAIQATARTKVVMAGLLTEICLAFPTLDMLRDGYEIYPVIDAVGGVSTVAHQTAVDRMVQAGAQPVTSLAFGSELMRNWARPDADRYRKVVDDYFRRKRAGQLSGDAATPDTHSERTGS